jgi:signal transduction histidine kinase
VRRVRSANARYQLSHYNALSTFSHTLLRNEVIDSDVLYQLALTMILEFSQADRGRLLVLGRSGRIKQAFSLPEPCDEELREHCREALSTQRPVMRRQAEPAESVLCIPLVGKHEPFGVLCLSRAEEQPAFERQQLDLATAFADQLAHSINAERLVRDKLESEHLAALGRMASRIVHDMNNPLTVLMGYSDLLLKNEKPRAVQEEILRRMLVQVEQMRQMLVDVLAYAGSRQRRPARDLDLAALLREQVETWLRSPEAAEVELHFEAAAPALVRGDSVGLTRAFRNLLVNAVEAAAPAGRVTVRVVTGGNDLLVDVRDTGSGIPPEVRDKLFQPFVSHGKAHGTGLGLVTAKNIVEEHRGALSYATGPEGTCFQVRLPALRPGL